MVRKMRQIRVLTTMAVLGGILVLCAEKASGQVNQDVYVKAMHSRSKNADAASRNSAYSQAPQKTTYASGQLIVKFKPEVAAKVYDAQKQGGFARVLPQAQSLDTLNTTYGLSRAERVFKSLETKDKQGTVTGVMTAADEARAVDAKFSTRAQRAPKDAVTPDLENIFLLTIAENADVLSAVQAYTHDANVVYAQPNYIPSLHVEKSTDGKNLKQRGDVKLSAEKLSTGDKIEAIPAAGDKVEVMPMDPYFASLNSWGQGYGDMWSLQSDRMNMPLAWEISSALGDGIVVAVVDTGVDHAHLDIHDNMWTDSQGYHGYDFYNNDHDPQDDVGHGTHVAGTIAAVSNDKGTVGIAFRAKIMAVKTFPSDDPDLPPTTDQILAQGLSYAADNGADIINNSWGYSNRLPSNPVIEDAIAYAYARGCLLVFSAGNAYHDDVYFYSPQNRPEVVSVAATSYDDKLAYFSSMGQRVSVSAPGGGTWLGNYPSYPYPSREILSTRAGVTDMYQDGYSLVGTHCYRAAGTSMAAPHVSGLAALLWSDYPWYTTAQVRAIVNKCVDNLQTGAEFDDAYAGSGRINASFAMQANPTIAENTKITSPAAADIVGPTPSIVSVRGSAPGASYTVGLATWVGGLYSPSIYIIGSGTTVTNGELAQWDISNLSSGDYYLKLSVTDSNGIQYVDTKQVRVDKHLLAGWPRQLDSAIYSSPLVADFSGTNPPGRNEIFAITESNQAWLLKPDGSVYSGAWPVTVSASIDSTPAAFDLDQNGDLEIIINAGSTLTVLHHDGSVAWSRSYGGGLITAGSVSVGDINGDSEPEIIYPYLNANRTKMTIRVLDRFGNTLAPWPFEFNGTNLDWRDSTVALADFDNDYDDDIVVLFADTVGSAPGTKTAHVYVLNQNKQPLSGWPKTFTPSVDYLTGNMNWHGRIAVGDANNDGNPEVFFGLTYKALRWVDGYRINVSISRFYGLTRTGTNLAGWPCGIFPMEAHNITLADIDSNGKSEVITHSNALYGMGLFVIDYEGYDHGHWAIAITDDQYYSMDNIFPSAAVVGDVSGDGLADIVVGSSNTDSIYAFDRDGVYVPIGMNDFVNARVMQGKYPFIATTPTITDVNGNGKVDLVVGGLDGKIYVWNLNKNLFMDTMEWPMFHGDLQHRGNKDPSPYRYLNVPGDYATIQNAINSAIDRNIVLVAPGVYPGNVDFNGKAIILKGINGPDETIIDGGGLTIGVVITSYAEGLQAVIDGFTIRNGYSAYTAAGLLGRGIIRNCKIIGNTSTGWSSGAMQLDNGESKIINCLIADNTGEYGAIDLWGTGLILVNSTITNNHAEWGGAIVGQFASVESTNSIIRTGDVPGPAIAISMPPDPPPEGLESPPIQYSNIQGYSSSWGIPGEGNIDSDPLFADPANGDYSLRSHSPCIDSGHGDFAPYLDIDGNPRYDDRRVMNRGAGDPAYTDMGAFERQTDSRSIKPDQIQVHQTVLE